AGDGDAFLLEHPALDHDPVDFFRRGQIFVSFESDDPAPAYLREALGDLGEDLACFSADYGHWDGVLTDCVKNVARTRPYAREHPAKRAGGHRPALLRPPSRGRGRAPGGLIEAVAPPPPGAD